MINKFFVYKKLIIFKAGADWVQIDPFTIIIFCLCNFLLPTPFFQFGLLKHLACSKCYAKVAQFFEYIDTNVAKTPITFYCD